MVGFDTAVAVAGAVVQNAEAKPNSSADLNPTTQPGATGQPQRQDGGKDRKSHGEDDAGVSETSCQEEDELELQTKMGHTGYFLLALVVCLCNCGVCIAVWSSMGCDDVCLDILRDNEAAFYLCAAIALIVVVLLYLLDFFIPPHIPHRRFLISESDCCIGPLLVTVVVVNFFLACYFCAKTYPSAPLVITIFLLPVSLGVLRKFLKPKDIINVEERRGDLAERMTTLSMIIKFEIDQITFYSATARALLCTSAICAAVWGFWAFSTRASEDTIQKLERSSGGQEAKEVSIILWSAPLVAAVSYLLFAAVSYCRVLLSKRYAQSNASVNNLQELGDDSLDVNDRIRRLQRLLHSSSEISLNNVGNVSSISIRSLDTNMKEEFLRQHAAYMKRMVDAVKLTICGFIVLLSILYIVTQLVASGSHIATMAQGYIGCFFLTILGFVYLSFYRLFYALKMWLVDLPLFKSAIQVSQSNIARGAIICIVLPAVPMFFLLSAANQLVRRCRGIHGKVPKRKRTKKRKLNDHGQVATPSETPNPVGESISEEVSDVDFAAYAAKKARILASGDAQAEEAILLFLTQEAANIEDGDSRKSNIPSFETRVMGSHDPYHRIKVEVAVERRGASFHVMCDIVTEEAPSHKDDSSVGSPTRVVHFEDSEAVHDKSEDDKRQGNEAGRILTDRVHRFVESMRTWDLVSVVRLVYIWSILFAGYTLSPRLLNVFLSWLSWFIADWHFAAILAVTFFSGLVLFLLPPVPGAPVYLFGGVVITQKYMSIDGPGGFWVGASTCIMLGFVLKLCACAMQQKMIGENLGASAWVRQQIGVHKPFIRALESILARPGLTFSKCVVLCGGPDWPTSVLCGVLKLSLWQCELGTFPIIFYVAPLSLTGCFYVMMNDGEVYYKLGQLMFFLTMLITVVLWALIAWAVQSEFDRNYESFNRPMEKYVDLDWMDHRARQVANARAVQWSEVPTSLRICFVVGAIGVDAVAWGFYQFPTLFFGKFEVTDEFLPLVEEAGAFYGSEGLVTPFGLAGLIAILVCSLGWWMLSRWRLSATRNRVRNTKAEMDELEPQWKANRVREAQQAAAKGKRRSKDEYDSEGTAVYDSECCDKVHPSEAQEARDQVNPMPSTGETPSSDDDLAAVAHEDPVPMVMGRPGFPASGFSKPLPPDIGDDLGVIGNERLRNASFPSACQPVTMVVGSKNGLRH